MSEKQHKKRSMAWQGEVGDNKQLLLPLRWYWLTNWQGWMSIATLLGMLYIVVRSVTEASWVTPQPSLLPVLVLAVAAGLGLSIIRIHSFLAHALALLFGAGVLLGQGTAMQPGGELSVKFSHFLREIGAWWQAAITGNPSPGTIQVALIFCLFIWLIGYLSAWFISRRQNPWIAISLGAVALLSNLSFLPQYNYKYFLLYLLAALFLAFLTNCSSILAWFGKQPVHYFKLGINYFLPSILCLTIVMLSAAWLAPQFRVLTPESLTKIGLPWSKEINGSIYNFFAKVPAQKPVVNHDSMKGLSFTGAPRLSDEIVYIVKTQKAGYWWTKKYDIYTSQGWLASPGQFENLKSGLTRTSMEPYSPNNDLTYTVITRILTEIMLGQSEFVSSDIPVKMETLAPDDVVAIISSKTLKPNQQYAVTAHLPVATNLQLSQAGRDYPQWLTDRYLQLPADFPDSIKQLAKDLTKDIETPYDKAIAIIQFLSHIPYSLNFEAPPPGADGVENFLFTTRSGDCVYFASAMTVMLRSVGVPTRLSAGYLGGQWDEELKSYVIRERNSHAWPEIYFPDYGWITFEPTPGAVFEETMVVPIVPVDDSLNPDLAQPETTNNPDITQPITTVNPDSLQPIPNPSSITPQPTASLGQYPVLSGGVGSTLPELSWIIEYFMSQGYSEAELSWLIENFLNEGYWQGDLVWLIGNYLNADVSSFIESQMPTSSGILTDEYMNDNADIASSSYPNQGLPASEEGETSTGTMPPQANPDGGAISVHTQSSPVSEATGVIFIWVALALALVMFMFGLIYYRSLVFFKRLGTANAVYAKVCLLASLTGLSPQPQQTALEHFSRLSTVLPQQVEAIGSIAEAYIKAKYSRNKLPDGLEENHRLQESWHTVRHALLKRLFSIRSDRL